MLSGFLGIFPAWLGDRKKALQFFSKANLEFFCDPFYQCTEYAMTSDEQHKPYGIVTPFLAGRGSLLSGLMMGLTRLSIWHDNVDDWLEGPIVLPEGWEEIEIARIWIKGRPARVRAVNGAEHARIEWLEAE